MILYEDIEQGSDKWVSLRLGRLTASEADKIVTPTGKLSDQSRKYAYRLIAEKLLNRPMQALDNLEWIQHGKENEPFAAKAYEFMEEVKTKSVGFITSDDGLIGASPDRLILGANAALEIKCASPQIHIGYMIDGFELKYKPQVMTQMLVGEFEYVDRYAYSNEFPAVKDRTYRDEGYIAKLKDAFAEFNDNLLRDYKKIKSQGLFEERTAFQTAHEAAYIDQIEQLTGG